MTEFDTRRVIERIRKKRLLKEAEPAAPVQVQENTNRVYLYRAQLPQFLPGVGKFFPAMFSASKTDKGLTTANYLLTNSDVVFCRVLNPTSGRVMSLNFDWSKARLFTFTIRYKIDYQKLENWFNQQVRAGRVVSSFFVR